MPNSELDIHVIPIGDFREHDTTSDCWCRPYRDDEDPLVVIHNPLDQRELYEQGKRAIQ